MAERARALGLQQPAEDILQNKLNIDMYSYIDKNNSDLDTYDKVEKGIIHIIAHMISTDIKVLTFFRKLYGLKLILISYSLQSSLQEDGMQI